MLGKVSLFQLGASSAWHLHSKAGSQRVLVTAHTNTLFFLLLQFGDDTHTHNTIDMRISYLSSLYPLSETYAELQPW
jgi:hypothetical protein